MVFIAKNSGGATLDNLKIIQSNIFFKIFGLIGTTFFTFLGGYVAANFSKPNSSINAFVMGILSLILGIGLAFLAPGISSNWKVIVGIIVTLPAAIIGGWFADRSVV